MKKTLKFAVVLAIAVCTLVIGVSAAVSIDYRFEPVEGTTDIYDFVVKTTSDFPVGTHMVEFTYDNTVFKPVNQNDNSVIETISDRNKTAPVKAVVYSDEYGEFSYDVQTVVWTGTTVNIPFTSTDYAPYFPYAAGMDVLTVRFQLAGKESMKEVEEADFNVVRGFVGDKNDATNTYGFGESNGAENPVTPTITYYTEKSQSITVPAGSTVYFQDGTHTTYQAETQVDIDLNYPGYVVVNTGYTAQKIYKVSGAAITPAPENALLGSDYTEIRTKEPAGVRYKAVITDEARKVTALDVKEYGFIATAETTNLSKDYHLDMALVDEGKAIKGVAFDANTNKVFSYDSVAEATTFTAVVHGVDPTNATQLTTVIAVRSYMITGDGKIVYGEVTKSTVYDTAKAIKAAGGSAYDGNKEYIDNVIKTVETNAKDSVMDVSGLYQ